MRHKLHTILAAAALATLSLFTGSCTAAPPGSAEQAGNSTSQKPKLSFDLVNGICASTADGAYQVCGNPLTSPPTYTVKASAPWARGYALTYDSATKSWRTTMPDGTTAVYKPGTGLTVEPALPQISGKEPQRTAYRRHWERWLCAHTVNPYGSSTA